MNRHRISLPRVICRCVLSVIALVVVMGEGVEAKTLFSKIEEAQKILANEPVQIIKEVVATRRVRIGRRRYQDIPVMGIVGREMAIAVLTPEGEIKTIRAIKRDKGMDVLTPGTTLFVRRDNGINSDIACIEPKGGKVILVKYPVTNENNRFGGGSEVIEATYTPYSAEIKDEEVIAQGIKIMDKLIDKAYDQLKMRRVPSRVEPDKLVTQVIPKNILKVLLLNEHIDPSLFKSPSEAKSLVEMVLTIIAANGEKAYTYSISRAGARGLVQMVPSTYRLLQDKYVQAGLRENFSIGMVDTVNAVMAQVLLCDSDWQAIASRRDIEQDKIGAYLAAAYNGGVGRVLTIVNREQSEWLEAPESNPKPTITVQRKVPIRVAVGRGRRKRMRTVMVTKSFTHTVFKSETANYVKQYHWIEEALEKLEKTAD